MNCYLLDGIRKIAFLDYKKGTGDMRAWGGTAADIPDKDTGFAASIPGMAVALSTKSPWGMVAGQAIDLGVNATYGRYKAEQAGARYGAQLGKSNPYLAMRL